MSFWGTLGAPSVEAMQQRLSEVVCVLRRGDSLIGCSTVSAAEVGLIGGRRFWIYRVLLDRAIADQAPAMFRATFEALQEEFDNTPGGPIGLCALLADPEERRQRPELKWSDPRTIYAGYLPEGQQVRIAYFYGAAVTPVEGLTAAPVMLDRIDLPLSPDYQVEPFAEQQRVTAQDVAELWIREARLTPEEARRRVAEIVMVATDAQHRPVGVSTAYLQRNDQLRAELWYTRLFVAPEHRRSGLGIALVLDTKEHLVERHRSGADRRGIGILFEIQSEMIKRHFPWASWGPVEFFFIGEGARGSHTRAHYFPGALAPEPDPRDPRPQAGSTTWI